jgi:hypothetical protein
METLQILALIAAAAFCKALSVLAQRTAGRSAQASAPTTATPTIATAAAIKA